MEMEDFTLKFTIKNIGAIDKASIELQGITIIAGENNVGKSTVGKSIYAFLSEMSSWKQMYENICRWRIERFLYVRSTYLEDLCMKISGAKRRRTNKTDQLISEYSTNEDFQIAIEDFQVAFDEDKSKKEVKNSLYKYFESYCFEYMSLYSKEKTRILWEEQRDVIREWIEKMISEVRTLELDELKLQLETIAMSMQNVFNAQYRKIGTEESVIIFEDDNERIVKFVQDSEGKYLNMPIRLSNRVFFIESPKIYDFLSNPQYGHVQKEYLQYLMTPNVFKKYNNRYFNNQIRNFTIQNENGNTMFENITEHLVEVMGGRAEFFQKVGLEFKDKYISEPIHSVNVSTGLKSLALLEYALRIGAIEDGDILILDEPEINLHPEWQVEYAHSLVMLQKMYHLKIVITTHSPYFMRSIECFTDIHGTMDSLNVYRVKRDKDNHSTEVENVSYSEYGITDLYDDLSAPLEELEKLLEEKYGDGRTE